MTRSEAPVRRNVGNPTLRRSIVAVPLEEPVDEVEEILDQRRQGGGVCELRKSANHSVCIASEYYIPI